MKSNVFGTIEITQKKPEEKKKRDSIIGQWSLQTTLFLSLSLSVHDDDASFVFFSLVFYSPLLCFSPSFSRSLNVSHTVNVVLASLINGLSIIMRDITISCFMRRTSVHVLLTFLPLELHDSVEIEMNHISHYQWPEENQGKKVMV